MCSEHSPGTSEACSSSPLSLRSAPRLRSILSSSARFRSRCRAACSATSPVSKGVSLENLEALLHGFTIALSGNHIFLMLIGVLLGILVGVLPGLGAPNGVSLLLPLTFGMQPVSAIILLSSIYWGALFGGSVTSMLFNSGGEPSSVATTSDGYPMARDGRPTTALATAFGSAAFGALVGVVLITLLASWVAKVALAFGPAGYFAGFVGMGGSPAIKTVVSLAIGFAIAAIGIDTVSGSVRLTMGIDELVKGVSFVVAVMGLFGIGELMIAVEDELHVKAISSKVEWGEVGGTILHLPRRRPRGNHRPRARRSRRGHERAPADALAWYPGLGDRGRHDGRPHDLGPQPRADAFHRAEGIRLGSDRIHVPRQYCCRRPGAAHGPDLRRPHAGAVLHHRAHDLHCLRGRGLFRLELLPRRRPDDGVWRARLSLQEAQLSARAPGACDCDRRQSRGRFSPGNADVPGLARDLLQQHTDRNPRHSGHCTLAVAACSGADRGTSAARADR